MNILKYISITLFALSLASCSTKQESIIEDYNELIEDAEQLCNEDFDEYAFMRLTTEHEGLLDEINNGDIEFNKQQQQELDRLEKNLPSSTPVSRQNRLVKECRMLLRM